MEINLRNPCEKSLVSFKLNTVKQTFELLLFKSFILGKNYVLKWF